MRMNNKGQFSIIAALLVAVVLIATVITTYTSIRYGLNQSQPQVLSAVDETNFALKQLLGFTLGYYGSILQVTGNTSYAQILAKNYLHSGLENIADIKPEWGLSFNVTSLNLHVDWFTPESFSSGQFSIKYNLTGLGFYGLTYNTTSRLDVQVLEAEFGDSARVSVFKEEYEPLNTLAKNNFKFYRYIGSDQTWELVNLSTEPVVFANGTYSINVPDGVDSANFLVQVEDLRGIVTIVSSFSQFASTINWNSAYGDGNYVDDVSDLYLPSGKGTHSDFTAQQFGPDLAYDQLTEVNIGGGATNTTLINAESFEGSWIPAGWSETSLSRWNKEADQHFDGSYSADFDGDSGYWGYLTTPDLPSSSADSIYIDFWYLDGGCEPGEFQLQYYDGNNWDTIFDLGTSTENQWHHYQQEVADSQYFKLTFKIRFYANTGSYTDDGYIDRVTVVREVDDSNYELDLEEQWRNVTLTNPNQYLCINTGALGSENLRVDVRSGSNWVNLIPALATGWNNVSVSSYISSNFTIRFNGASETSDSAQNSWLIDAVLLRPESDLGSLLMSQDSTICVEWLQNGTMRWLGQNMELTMDAMPIPPIPVKAFHLSQTIGGVEQEVAFQIEDWASSYRVPLGMTSEVTVFSNKQMIVFLLNRNVSNFTLWWDGSDLAVQTPHAYTPGSFTDNPDARTLNNGRIGLQFGSGFTVTSTAGGISCAANFMQINTEDSSYGAREAYVIYNAPVRDIVQQEAEWNGGAGPENNVPNLYANIVLTLPAGTSYFTYQVRLMFIESQLDRTITDFTAIRLTSSITTLQTENGTINNIAAGSGTFSNNAYPSSWTQHHWSQFNGTGGAGAGIMFTNTANQQLYAFDAIAGTPTGALKTSTGSRTIELSPITVHQISPFREALDITWHGAVATFDSAMTPIYKLNAESKPFGLWILVEFQPTITVTAER